MWTIKTRNFNFEVGQRLNSFIPIVHVPLKTTKLRPSPWTRVDWALACYFLFLKKTAKRWPAGCIPREVIAFYIWVYCFGTFYLLFASLLRKYMRQKLSKPKSHKTFYCKWNDTALTHQTFCSAVFFSYALGLEATTIHRSAIFLVKAFQYHPTESSAQYIFIYIFTFTVTSLGLTVCVVCKHFRGDY